jgi:predicted dienelactone hydrolase
MSSTWRRSALAIVFWLTAPATAAAVVGEAHRTASSPTAALRDAEHRRQIRITVWYPAPEGAVAQALVIGPPDQPTFRIGSVAPDAPFAADAPGHRRAVILLSHGCGGTARLMGWFGTAMAEAGYVVVSVDHPGNNGVEPMTVAGAILPWERAEDRRADPSLHLTRT